MTQQFVRLAGSGHLYQNDSHVCAVGYESYGARDEGGLSVAGQINGLVPESYARLCEGNRNFILHLQDGRRLPAILSGDGPLQAGGYWSAQVQSNGDFLR